MENNVDFYTFKIGVMEATGLDKDALHIYVGISVYLLSLLLFRSMIKNYSFRSFVALVLVTGVALLGEYLDNRQTINELGISGLGGAELKESIHDIINTCLWPYVIFALSKWTKIFHSTIKAKPMIKRQRTMDY